MSIRISRFRIDMGANPIKNLGQGTSATDVARRDEVVLMTGDQTVAGVKTFSSFPVTPSSEPTTDYQAANKKYVDDGWAAAGTFTYASATTITVASGAASIYQVGDKIKLTQTTAKYFYITVVADTLLTVDGAGLYTVANAAITLPYYSHQASPLGFPIKMIPGYVKARAYMSADTVVAMTDAVWCSLPLDLKSYDTGGDLVTTARAYTNDPAAGASIALNMANTSGFTVNDAVNVTSSAGHETAIITSISAGVSITVNNLTLNHTTTNPKVTVSKFIVPVTGYYEVRGKFNIETSHQYSTYFGIYVDPLFVGLPAIKTQVQSMNATASKAWGLEVDDLIFLNKTDAVYLYLKPGGTLFLPLSGEHLTSMSIVLVSVI